MTHTGTRKLVCFPQCHAAHALNNARVQAPKHCANTEWLHDTQMEYDTNRTTVSPNELRFASGCSNAGPGKDMDQQ
eukprot:10735093-Alexandrium_andersonii.AAC.1